MTAKIWLEINYADGIRKRDVRPNPESAESAIAEGECPGCHATPFYVKGGSPTIQPDDRTIRSNGRCVTCGEAVGYIYAQPDTIFGLREDRAVLEMGRCRVY